jgi:hypothetical protein
MAEFAMRNRGYIFVAIGITILIIGIIMNSSQPDNLFVVPVYLLGGISLLIGVVSLFLPHKEKKGSITDTWECDECSTDVKETDKTCPKCGVEFEE